METTKRDAFEKVDVITDTDVDHYTPPAEGTINVFEDDGHPWCVTFGCPCGCGDLVMVPVKTGSWQLERTIADQVTLTPSVSRSVGCRSHFFVRNNGVVWC